MANPGASRSTLPLLIAAVGGVVLGAGLLQAWNSTGGRTQTETIVRNYILDHPEILPEAMKRLQAKETGQLIARHLPALETPFKGAWAGDAKGDVTLVMFTDYSCGYCRASAGDIDRLLASDKKLKVVWREIPILGPGSEAAAHVALAAAQQGRYLDFHRRMFAAGPPDQANLLRIQKDVGITIAPDPDGTIGREIETNLALARELGMTGTPTFVIGTRILQGAVGYEALSKAIADARSAS